jgi:hypothetical protein
VHENAADCYIDSHWSEHILSLFLRGEERAEQHAISEIEAKCRCLGVSVDELSLQIEDEESPAAPSYEEDMKRQSEKAIYFTNLIRFGGRYREIEDNDTAFRKVRGDINRLAGLKAAGITFSRASLEQRKHWVKVAEELSKEVA